VRFFSVQWRKVFIHDRDSSNSQEESSSRVFFKNNMQKKGVEMEEKGQPYSAAVLSLGKFA